MFYVRNFESAEGLNRKHLRLHVATLKLTVKMFVAVSVLLFYTILLMFVCVSAVH